MSARLPQHADHSFDEATHRGNASATLAMTWRDARPYAIPNPPAGAVDAVLIDAIRMAVGPYVPAPLRASVRPTAAATVTTAEHIEPAQPLPIENAFTAVAPTTTPRDLPWIDAFLDASADETIPAAPVTFAVVTPAVSIFAASDMNDSTLSTFDADADAAQAHALFSNAIEPQVAVGLDASVLDESVLDESVLDESVLDESVLGASAKAEGAPEASVPDEVDTSSTDATTDSGIDEWPLVEASAAMEELAKGLAPEVTADEAAAAHQPSAASESADVDEPPTVEPMSMWADDDLMDIMPVRRMRSGGDEGEPWADQARRQVASGGAEAAATALESLARRVRDGQLVLPGYTSEMGEPAALAAALAALLGVRQ